MRLTRRTFIASSLLLMPAARAMAEEPFPIDTKAPNQLPYKFQRREMAYDTTEPAGTIVVESKTRFMYLIQDGGQAIRYGCALGKGAKAWTGEVIIKKKATWPKWTPAPYHLSVKPELSKWLPDGMPGGPDNPMGARALYLFKGDVDTINRIHGAAKLNEIGKKATAGCIGMLNGDIVDLYDRVEVGTRVVMI
jgi:lipoprotein-anchoring transpeptidase ErfK/SrfK